MKEGSRREGSGGIIECADDTLSCNATQESSCLHRARHVVMIGCAEMSEGRFSICLGVMAYDGCCYAALVNASTR